MPVSLAHVLTEANLRAAWSRTKKRAQFAYQGQRGEDVESDAQVLAELLAEPVSAVRELLAAQPLAPSCAGLATQAMALSGWWPPTMWVRRSAVRELLADVADLAQMGAGFGSKYQLDQTAEPVCPIEIEGRVVYGHDIRTRVLQRAFAQVVGAEVEKALPPTVFSYRAGRDRWTALLGARRVIARASSVFVAKVDVRRFFPSVRVDQVVGAFAALAPDVTEALVRLAVWFCTAPILRSGPTLEAPLYALYQGSIAAPLLSNLVGAHVIDLPVRRYAPKGVHVFRYGDDVLLLGTDAGVVTHARDVVVELIESAGWEAHPEKTFACARDLRDEAITWLGKTVSAAGVATPAAKLTERVDALVSLEHGDPRSGSMAAALLGELFLDSAESLDSTLAQVERQSPRHGRIARRMAAHLRVQRRKRMRTYDRLLAPLFA